MDNSGEQNSLEYWKNTARWWQDRAYEELIERIRLQVKMEFMEKKERDNFALMYEFRYLDQNPLDWPLNE